MLIFIDKAQKANINTLNGKYHSVDNEIVLNRKDTKLTNKQQETKSNSSGSM